MPSVQIDVSGIFKLITHLNKSLSPGFDDLITKFWKTTGVYCYIIITKIFQQLLAMGTLPNKRKIGKVSSVYKSGNKNIPCNSRPISLTSNCCKILKHVIYSNFVNYLESNSFFAAAQHGFRKSYSRETQLIYFTHKLHRMLDRSSHADYTFLDFSKDFYKVSHGLLLPKLNQLNNNRSLLTWIE